MALTPKITNLAGTGGEQTFTVDAETVQIDFHAVGGDVTMLDTSGGDSWTIVSGSKESLQGRNFRSSAWIFDHGIGVTLEIREWTQNLS